MHTWLTAGLMVALGRMPDSIFSGLKLLTPMLLTSPSSTHFSRAAQVSSKGGSTFGPVFTDVGLQTSTHIIEAQECVEDTRLGLGIVLRTV